MNSTTWTDDRGNRIAQSSQHKDLFLITTPDGGWYSIQSSLDIMQSRHKQQQVKQRKR